MWWSTWMRYGLQQSEKQHVKLLIEILGWLQAARLCLRKFKCTIDVSSVTYLDHMIDAKGSI